MRALRQIAGIVSLLFASAMAESFIDSASFRGRALANAVEHADGEISETPFPKYTYKFDNGPGTYAPDSRDPDWKITQVSMIGIAVGGGATLIFFIFAIINIIVDEVQRHADFKNQVANAIQTLTEDYDVGEDQLAEMLQEFELQELKGDAFDAEAERRELAAIN